MLVVSDRIGIPSDEFSFDYVRSSGPGGQNVNKVSSKAVLKWHVISTSSLPDEVKDRFVKKYARRISQEGWLLVSSQRFRDRGRNVNDCLEKLRDMILEVAAPPKKRRPTQPTRSSQRRRLQEKQIRARKKDLRRGPTFD